MRRLLKCFYVLLGNQSSGPLNLSPIIFCPIAMYTYHVVSALSHNKVVHVTVALTHWNALRIFTETHGMLIYVGISGNPVCHESAYTVCVWYTCELCGMLIRHIVYGCSFIRSILSVHHLYFGTYAHVFCYNYTLFTEITVHAYIHICRPHKENIVMLQIMNIPL